MKRLLSILLVVLIILGGSGYLLGTAANASVPGDTLYPVDLLAESLQRALTFNKLSLTELEQDILEERIEEVDTLVENNIDEDILEQAIQALEKQRVRMETRLQTLINENSNFDENRFDEVRFRYENTIQTQISRMEKIQIKYTNMGEDVKKGFEEALVTLEAIDEARKAGNQEQNADSGDAGDGIKDRESNYNPDPGTPPFENTPEGTANQSGR